MNLAGSPNQRYSVKEGTTYQLPSSWYSPEKYQYTLKGWYDIKNNRWYAPGAAVTVTENLVFYADWVAATYDIGRFNTQTSETVSTNSFIKTHVFDYNNLFNVQSQKVTSYTINNNSHSETWELVTNNGTVPYQNGKTLDFIFLDHDSSGKLSAPNKRDNSADGRNNTNRLDDPAAGIYSEELGDILFDPDMEVIGKTYIGEGDHLFRYMSDPSDEYYGYYFYDSKRNAASYNQSDGRFYVYNYLERTVDSDGENNDGKYSDFLPFNSPYANTTGLLTPHTYTYNGNYGEYRGVQHYQYDSRGNNNYVITNYAFGIAMEIDMYLPNVPGTFIDGESGNRDIYGNEMHFHFSGDDDVWVVIDGKVVLDLGGIHRAMAGDINFSTGVVTIGGNVNNELSNRLKTIPAGEHTLEFYYLERGSSMSNCEIYFNLAPRFNLSLQKEDVLTRDRLNGAQFSVFMDSACSIPAKLWGSKEDYTSGAEGYNTFEVVNGVANIWGFGAGNTYYIKETKPPDSGVYESAYGIIKLELNKFGIPTYSVEILEDESGISPGFTVHGIRFDEETQQAFIVATNAATEVKGRTEVTVEKAWDDRNKDHGNDYVTVYLTVTQKDGTVLRLQEAVLGEANHWSFTWKNLPEYWDDEESEDNRIHYSVEEGYFPGYYGSIEFLGHSDTGFSYEITNRPIDQPTSLKVMKEWYINDIVGNVDYDQARVTMKLLANGRDTGRTVTLSYQNDWTATFENLPYKDAAGNVIAYSVEESWKTDDWTPRYGEVIEKWDGTYETTVTNIYNWGNGVELPSTGGSGQIIWVLGGFVMMTGSLVCGYLLRRRRERRAEE